MAFSLSESLYRAYDLRIAYYLQKLFFKYYNIILYVNIKISQYLVFHHQANMASQFSPANE